MFLLDHVTKIGESPKPYALWRAKTSPSAAPPHSAAGVGSTVSVREGQEGKSGKEKGTFSTLLLRGTSKVLEFNRGLDLESVGELLVRPHTDTMFRRNQYPLPPIK